MRSARWGLLLLGALLVGGVPLACVPFELVGGTARLPEYGFDVTLPSGWYRAMRAEDMLLITRDGTLLQHIRIQRVAVDAELKHTKRKFGATMSPLEVAEVELDEHRSDAGLADFTVEENAPAMVGGRRGFKLVYSARTKDGLRLKRAHYGFVDGKWVYRLIYQAAARHYFEKDLATFEQVRESFKLLGSAA